MVQLDTEQNIIYHGTCVLHDGYIRLYTHRKGTCYCFYMSTINTQQYQYFMAVSTLPVIVCFNTMQIVLLINISH